MIYFKTETLEKDTKKKNIKIKICPVNTCRHINIINYVLDVPLGLTIYTLVDWIEGDSTTQTIWADGRAALTEVSAINSHHIITFGVYYNHQSFDSEEAISRWVEHMGGVHCTPQCIGTYYYLFAVCIILSFNIVLLFLGFSQLFFYKFLRAAPEQANVKSVSRWWDDNNDAVVPRSVSRPVETAHARVACGARRLRWI